jgi:uncharacterized lipoprotein YddW (UPF0748 family)
MQNGENASQWREISKRLQQAGIDYCLVDGKWSQKTDLEKIKVLFLPNVETLNAQQAINLEVWMDQGGRVIVTGPTGNLSNVVVRDKVRSLFGAYWAFPLTSASILRPEKDGWKEQKALSATMRGGVLIPSAINSQTAAVWLSDALRATKGDRKFPAVVLTDKSTFFGWRWGSDAFTSPALDSAWLKAALKRYGLNSSVSFASTSGQPKYCNGNYATLPQQQTLPVKSLPNSSLSALSALSPMSAPFPRSSSPPPIYQDAREIRQFDIMGKELNELIARVESTVITADASKSDFNSNTEQVIREQAARGGKSSDSSSYVLATRSHRLLTEAKQSLSSFYQLVKQGNYSQARQEWINTRRNLWQNYPTDRPLVQPEIRAVWLDRGTIVKCRSEAELALIFDRLAAAGMNTVFFETINASYPIYPSRIAPEQNPLTRGWDPLKTAVKLAHERKMELHAWVWVFAAANQAHNKKLNLPINYLGPVLSRYPNWAITDKKGHVFDHSRGYKKAFLDPANPQVQRYLLALVEEIAANYDVDGIQLDYIRYPFQSAKEPFGYSNISRQQFKAMTGIDPVNISPYHPLWNQWTGFRVQQVDNFVAAASRLIKQKYPDKILSVAVFPMNPRERLFRIQQNWEEWGRNHWVDLVFLMTYALDTENLEERTRHLEHPALTEVSSLVVPGIRLLNVPNPVTMDQIQSLRGIGTTGYALFAAENFNPELEDILKRTQGNSSLEQPLPYRQPFQAAEERYLLLQKEWNFLLSNNQLVMEESAREDWAQRADNLASILNQLAASPSAKKLQEAQTALESFQRRFPRWMQEYQKTQPYQVESWTNRLDTLDQLLQYGKNTVLKSSL